MCNVFFYRADIFCTDCGNGFKRAIDADSPPRPEECDDSERYPQGPIGNGGGEADTPQHCGKCGTFLENPLTREGRIYVEERIETARIDRKLDSVALTVWAQFYGMEEEPTHAA